VVTAWTRAACSAGVRDGRVGGDGARWALSVSGWTRTTSSAGYGNHLAALSDGNGDGLLDGRGRSQESKQDAGHVDGFEVISVAEAGLK
jgi:hypothetical protein